MQTGLERIGEKARKGSEPNCFHCGARLSKPFARMKFLAAL
jgi:hypothetical protein